MNAQIFICHRHEDADQALRLATDLQNGGFSVWLDQWRINLGDSIIGKMNEGLAETGFLLLCLSSSQVTAPWMSREWYSALSRQLNGEDIRLIPVRLSGGRCLRYSLTSNMLT